MRVKKEFFKLFIRGLIYETRVCHVRTQGVGNAG